MTKYTTCRVKENTKNKIQYAQNVLGINEELLSKDKKSKNYSEDEVIDKSLDKLLEFMGVEMKDDITDNGIKAMENVLKKHRIDNNFKPKNKRILKSLADAMFDKGMVKDRLSYDSIITILIENYLEQFPEFKKYALVQQDINQQFRTKEMRRQKGIE